MKIHELVEGVEYECGDSKYRVAIDGFFEFKMSSGEWTESYALYNTVIGMEFTECEFEPGISQRYCFPDFYDIDSWGSRVWKNNDVDKSIRRNVGAYRTKEQAIQKAKELGWVE